MFPPPIAAGVLLLLEAEPLWLELQALSKKTQNRATGTPERNIRAMVVILPFTVV
jgi:hypothetical protein